MGLWDSIVETVSDVVETVVETVREVVETVVDGIIALVTLAARAIDEVFGTNLVGDPVQVCPYPDGPPQICDLIVTVKSKATGRPIEGANVRIDGEQMLEAVTDAEGRTLFEQIRAGDYQISAIKDDYTPEYQNKTCEPEMTNTAELELAGSGFGLLNMEMPEYLAPGLTEAEEPFAIGYTVEDPGENASRIVMEVFKNGEETTPSWTHMIEGDDIDEGSHQFKWDGAIDANADFPGAFVTIEHSPYKVRMTLEGSGEANPDKQEGEFKIEVTKIELKLGSKTTLSRAKDKSLCDRIASVPAVGATKKANLTSNLFKTSSAEMNNNTAYTQYQSSWSDGPNIPLLAKVFVKASTGTDQVAKGALGKTKFLWDWDSVTEDTSSHHAAAKTFLDHALNYSKAATTPDGDNCHKDRGGKRGPGAVAVYPPQAGYAPAAALAGGSHPFKVTAASTRSWAALSEGWTGGLLGGHTGVIFQPSRMAGDGYEVSVHYAKPAADGSNTLDTAAAIPSSHKAISGTFEIGRSVSLAQYKKKNNNVTDFNVGQFQGYYRKAKVNVADNSGGSTTMPSADYNTKLSTAVAAEGFFVQAAVDSAVDQHAAGDYGIKFRTFAAWKTQMKSDRSWTTAQLNTWLASSSLTTSSLYHARLKSWAKTVVANACDGYMSANAGINIFHFIGLYNRENSPGGISLNGFAPSFPSASRSKCGFIQCAGATNYSGGTSNSAEQTITHEIGHHLFLPHAPSAPGNQANRHDEAWNNCIMSYHYDQERKFCGLCILRMRGWDATSLSKTGANNAKT